MATQAREGTQARGTPPGPRGSVLFGSLSSFRKDRLRFLVELTQVYGDVVRFRVGTRWVYLLNDPACIQHVLQTNARNYVKGRGLEKAKDLLGEGLLTSEGDFWLRQRWLIQPIFHRQRIASFAETMVRCASEMLDRWEPLAARAEPFDVHGEMMRLTLRIVGLTLFSTEVGDKADVVGRALPIVLEYTSEVAGGLGFFEHLPTRERRQYERALRELDGVVYGLIERRRRGESQGEDLLEMLLRAQDDEGRGMTDRQLRDEVMTLFLAGHETTANTLTWTLYLLSLHPGVARRLREELAASLGGCPPTVDDLPKLSYLSRVIDESMRVLPAVWTISRRAVGQDTVGGYRIPANAPVLLSQWAMHRHPRYWPNPEGFDPDRFLPEVAAERPRFAFFPFSGGPRQCIGNSFALQEAALVLAALLQRYRLDLVPGHRVELEPLITLRPRYGMRMTAHAA